MGDFCIKKNHLTISSRSLGENIKPSQATFNNALPPQKKFQAEYPWYNVKQKSTFQHTWFSNNK